MKEGEQKTTSGHEWQRQLYLAITRHCPGCCCCGASSFFHRSLCSCPVPRPGCGAHTHTRTGT
ncbi:uncharacterized protein B0I36DRAFT_319952 [Microdochium trichocladiopsis]|uniref:Uncharacterized protein n=1 Tax=Microdochium trichocladiopsis TaxID=1682393 RepID=A0A9P9BUX7_9PEZI|nr:uncharacterized protein B0I36DRAFT_319952 [Microdochium trichocladiopsis]KAH7032742.1 hypothetical protein B0I36DRAFT_319952 [Microdochium trichocladiopsis]